MRFFSASKNIVADEKQAGAKSIPDAPTSTA
jgi:hypothetical protein